MVNVAAVKKRSLLLTVTERKTLGTFVVKFESGRSLPFAALCVDQTTKPFVFLDPSATKDRWKHIEGGAERQ
jgi:IS30 family transposase